MKNDMGRFGGLWLLDTTFTGVVWAYRTLFLDSSQN